MDRRVHDGDPRHRQQALGHFHQLRLAGTPQHRPSRLVARRDQGRQRHIPGGGGDGRDDHGVRRRSRVRLRPGDRKAHVLYPGSDPLVTSCGGTSISNISGLNFTEHVWNDNDNQWITGGGVSDVFFPPKFPLPTWQSSANVPGSANDGHKARAIPDIAGNADGASGYTLFQNGANIGAVGGTSAIAPLYAGLVALINADLGEPVGYLNPKLYAAPSSVYRDINDGISNARAGAPARSRGRGWDACTGLALVNGVALQNALRDAGPAVALAQAPHGAHRRKPRHGIERRSGSAPRPNSFRAWRSAHRDQPVQRFKLGAVWPTRRSRRAAIR